MKKLLFVMILAVVLSIALYGCNKNDGPSLIVEYQDEGALIARTFVSGTKVPERSPTEKEGFDFKGWFEDSAFSKPFDFEKDYDGHIKVYAKYEKININITFKADGVVVWEKSVPYGGTLTDVPEVPEKEDGIGTWDRTSFSNLKENITVEAVYSPAVNVVFMDGDTVLKKIKAPKGGTVLFSDFFAADDREGYTFHWEMDGVEVSADIESVQNNIQINLIYSIIQLKINFIFEYEDSYESWEFFVDYGDDFDVSLIPAVPYISEGEIASWEEFDNKNLKDDITINANVQVATCVLYFRHNQFEEIREVLYGEKISLENIPDLPDYSDLVKENHKNFRWGDDANTDLTEVITQREVNFYIHYDVMIKVTIDLAIDTATLSETAFQAGENEVVGGDISIPAPEALGFRFLHWLGTDGDSEIKFTSGFISVSRDITLTAVWEDIFCTVHFGEISGVTFVSDYTQPVPYGTELIFSVLAEGVTVLGVFANGVEIIAGSGEYKIVVKEDMDISVKTSDLEVYLLSFYDTSENLVAVRSVTHGNYLVTEPKVQLPDIYVDNYWTYGTQGRFYFEENIITEGMDFHIGFVFKSFEINYYTLNDEHISTQFITYGQDLVLHTPLDLQGKLFFGWYYTKSLDTLAKASEISVLGKNINLYARYIDEKEYEEYSILGEWVSEDAILVFHSNGLVQLFRENRIYEYGYEVLGSLIDVAGEELYYDEVLSVLTFRGDTFQRTDFAVIIFYEGLGEYLVYTGEQEIIEGWWYLNEELTLPFAFEIDEEFLDAKLLRLYRSEQKNIVLNYHLNGGELLYAGSDIFAVTGSGVIGEFALATLNGKDVIWVNLQGEIVDFTYIMVSNALIIDVYAYTLSDESAADITGEFSAVIAGDTILVEFLPGGGYRFIRISGEKIFYSPIYCYSSTQTGENGESAFIDENGKEIIVDGDSVMVYYQNEQVVFSLYDNAAPVVKEYAKTDGEGKIFLNFLEEGAVSFNGTTASYYKISEDLFVVYYPQGNVTETKLIDLSEWDEAGFEMPEIFIGDFYAEGPFEEFGGIERMDISISSNGVLTFHYEGEGGSQEFSLYEKEENLYGCIGNDALEISIIGGKVATLWHFSEEPIVIIFERAQLILW